MVDKQDENTPSNADQPKVISTESSGSPDSGSATPSTQNKKTGSKFKRLCWLGFPLLLLACLTAFYFGMLNGSVFSTEVVGSIASEEGDVESSQVNSADSTDVQSYLAELESLSQQVFELGRQNQILEESLAALASTTEDEIRQLTVRAATPESRQRADWQLAEAEYLSRLASQRVAMEDRPEAAIALLEGADRILADVALPELRTARRQLALDLTKLRSAKMVDREGIYMRLDAVAEQVILLSRDQTTVENAASTSYPADQSGWLARQWKRLVSSTKDSINLRVEETEQILMLSHSDDALARANVVLLLRQAQLAVLQQQKGIYQQSLDQAAIALRTYYSNAQGGQELVGQIETLAVVEIDTALPDLASSSRAIRQAIDQVNSPTGSAADAEVAP